MMSIKHLNRKEKKFLTRLIIALSLFVVVFVIDKIYPFANMIDGKFSWLLPFFIYLAIYILIGYDVIIKAFYDIINLQPFGESMLMLIATFGAFALGIYRALTGMEIEGFDEGCAVLVFYQAGEFFQRVASGSARKNIADLMNIRPDTANVLRNGKVEVVDPEEIEVGETIVVYPGEKIPLDGKIVKGESTIDNKALTGESIPVDVNVNCNILSGGVNLTSEIEIVVEKNFYNSTASKILDLVENASDKKSKAENFISKFARYYTPSVAILALITAIIPGLITGDFQTWIYRALTFLVVSCPCALVISVPLTFFVAIGNASNKGVLIKGSNYLEMLNKANIFVFDKTGTLTTGQTKVEKIFPEDKQDEILKLASICEANSTHPIAKCIVEKYGKEPEKGYKITNIFGFGIVAEKDDNTILCGNSKLLDKYNIPHTTEENSTVVYVAENGKFVGYITISDTVKSEAKDVISTLEKNKYKTIMLTGDNKSSAEKVASYLGISDYNYSLLPQNKVEMLEKIMEEKNKDDVVCFVGDGINDAPSLVRSDIGIAMGAIGSDASLEAADVVLMQDNLNSLVKAKKIAKKAITIVKENIVFSIGVKVLIIILSALGFANMWLSIFGDVGVAVIAILNAIRANKIKNINN